MWCTPICRAVSKIIVVGFRIRWRPAKFQSFRSLLYTDVYNYSSGLHQNTNHQYYYNTETITCPWSSAIIKLKTTIVLLLWWYTRLYSTIFIIITYHSIHHSGHFVNWNNYCISRKQDNIIIGKYVVMFQFSRYAMWTLPAAAVGPVGNDNYFKWLSCAYYLFDYILYNTLWYYRMHCLSS